MVSFEIFVKPMLPSLSELKVLPSFCFAFKIPDDVAASNIYHAKKKNGYQMNLLKYWRLNWLPWLIIPSRWLKKIESFMFPEFLSTWLTFVKEHLVNTKYNMVSLWNMLSKYMQG